MISENRLASVSWSVKWAAPLSALPASLRGLWRPRRRQSGCRVGGPGLGHEMDTSSILAHHSPPGRPQSNHTIRASTVGRAFATCQAQSICFLMSNRSKSPAAHGSGSQMLTWAHCSSQGQPCPWGSHPGTLPRSSHYPWPRDTLVALGTGQAGTLMVPLHNGEISWGLGKERPSHFRPSTHRPRLAYFPP